MKALRHSVIRHSLFVILLPLLLVLPAAAQTITTRTLDFGSGPNGNTGEYTSQAIVNGNPAIAYRNGTESNLMFARNSAADGSGTWSVTTVDYKGSTGYSISLTVVNGNPAISYRYLNDSDLRYVRANDANGTSWGTPMTLDSAGIVGEYNCLRVVNGNPAISYYDATNGDLKYIRASNVNGTTWGTPVIAVSALTVGQFTSLAIVNGNPAISYYALSGGDLKFVRATDTSGTTWGTPVTVVSTDDVGKYTSLAVVSSNPAISYFDETNDDLKYVRASDANGASWGTPVTLDSAGSVGQYTSLAIVNGRPAVAYYDITNQDLKFVRANDTTGTAWGASITLTSDTTANAGQHASLITVQSNPAISYYDATNSDLKYVRASDASGTSWPVATTADAGLQTGIVGGHTSQAIVNGNPSVSYYDASNGDLKFVRASDASGMSWGAPATLDSAGDVGKYSSLAIINGRPAISYYDDTNDDLKYVRASDASGTSWGTPVTVASAGNVGQYTSLATINGNPAIRFYDVTNINLKYIRALDTSGASWSTPVTVDSSSGQSGFGASSLVVVDGNPAISYWYTGNNELKYTRANDANGTSWGTPVTVDSFGQITPAPVNSSLAVITGRPAISYYANTNGDLKYVRASDTSGTIWETPVTLDSTGDVGQYASLTVVSGNPAIAYYDVTNFDLKYVRASDSIGTNWGDIRLLVDGSDEQTGMDNSMAIVGGNPAISYYDATNTNLKWALISPFPDIIVEEPINTELTDGVSNVNFGTVSVGSSSGSKLFVVRNTGTKPLQIYGRILTGGNSGDFFGANPTGYFVPVGGNDSFYMSFTPTAAGTRSTTLQVFSDDPDEAIFDITLNGEALQDIDGDGLRDSWELTYWTSITGHSALDDSDHDGYVELLELAFGMNPTLPDASGLPAAINEGGYLTMTITKQAGVTYEVQSGGTLLTAQPDSFSASTTTVITDNATTLKVRDNYLIGTSPPRFMRVKVTAAP